MMGLLPAGVARKGSSMRLLCATFMVSVLKIWGSVVASSVR